MRLLRRKEKGFERLEETSGEKAAESEKVIQKMIEEGLSDAFPNLELLASEQRIGRFRPDTVAFDTVRNSFAVIEYKNVRNSGVVDQGISYYDLLMENKGEFVLMYHRAKRIPLEEDVGFNWDETRVIFIAPDFNEHQKRASRSSSLRVDLPIELYRIRLYEGGMVILDRVNERPAAGGAAPQGAGGPRGADGEPLSEEAYLRGEYRGPAVSEATAQLWNEAKGAVLERLPEVDCRQLRTYASFDSRRNNSAICTFTAQKDAIKLRYSLKKEGLLPTDGFIEYSEKGKFGNGNYSSVIRSMEDMEKAIPFIERVFRMNG